MWSIDNTDQTVTVLLSAALGVLLEMFYDVLKALRMERAHGTVKVFFEDILFFALSAPAVFCLMIMRTNGQLRSYVFLGLAAGFITARFLISPWNLRFLRFFVKTISRFFTKSKRFINRAEERLTKKINIFLKNFTKTVKKGLKRVNAMVYNHFNKSIRKNVKNGE